MRLSINKEVIYGGMFTACIAVPFLNIYELTFAVWCLVLLLTINLTYSLAIIKYVSCFVAILCIALISAMFHDYTSYNIIRDITYLLKPIVGLIVGYQLFKKTSGRAMSVFINAGIFLSVVHLCIVFFTMLKFRTLTVNLLREYGGYFSDYEIYVLIVLIFYKKFDLSYSKKKAWFLILIVGASCMFYLARTNFIQFFILFVAMKGYFTINKRSIVIVTTSILLLGISYTAIYISNPKRTGRGIEVFLYKIKNAPIEPFKTKINKFDWKDFNDNYRSYENIITVKQVALGGTGQIIYGKGVGATVNLGQEIWTNDGELIQFIPILHNSYATVFLKSGLIGVFFLVLFMYLIAKKRESDNVQVNNINLLLLGTAIFLIVSNWVFMGLYLKLDNKSILIGFFVCYREWLMKSDQKNLANGN